MEEIVVKQKENHKHEHKYNLVWPYAPKFLLILHSKANLVSIS
jgi:hypothetical protein